MRYSWLIAIVCAFALACDGGSDGSGNNTINEGDADVGSVDASGDDGVAADTDSPDQSADQDASPCTQVVADTTGFYVSYADDVSIEYSLPLSPSIDDQDRELSLLFERYNESVFVGTFELGGGMDDNFGNCTHCVFVRGNSRERAYFADAGTFDSGTDPYTRVADFDLSGLRLIEVAVDPFTRESAPLAEGRCIEVADFTASGTFPTSGWTCPTEQYLDGMECNCECGAPDPDCFEVGCLPGDPGCTPRQAQPVVGCDPGQLCAFDPVTMGSQCTDSCDWMARTPCAAGTCVFEFGVGDGDVCIDDGPRISDDVGLGAECPQNGLQIFCNIVAGFAEGFCGPNNVCRPICESDDDCTVDGETCRVFSGASPLGYCGPEPVDG